MTKILIVDDSHVERVLAKSLICKNPRFQVELAEDGEDALDKIRAGRPQLVLTDLLMPKMDGLQLLRAVRRDYPTIPVVLMTQFGDESTAVQALESGAASYVPKARQAEYLLPTIERVLDHGIQVGFARLGRRQPRELREFIDQRPQRSDFPHDRRGALIEAFLQFSAPRRVVRHPEAIHQPAHAFGR